MQIILTSPTLINIPANTGFGPSEFPEGSGLPTPQSSSQALTNSPAKSPTPLVKSKTAHQSLRTKSTTPDKSRSLQSRAVLTRSASANSHNASKRRTFNRSPLLRRLLLARSRFLVIQPLIDQSAIMQKSVELETTKSVQEVEAEKMREKLFLKAISHLHKPLSKIKRTYSPFPFYGHRKHHLGLGRFYSYVKLKRFKRRSKAFRALVAPTRKNLFVSTSLNKLPVFTPYNLKHRFYSSTPSRGRFTKSFTLLLSKKVYGRRSRKGLRKLLRKNRRAYRPRRGWKRNRLRRVIRRRFLRNALRSQLYSKSKAAFHKNLLSATYLKRSFKRLTSFQKKLGFNFFGSAKYTPFFSRAKKQLGPVMRTSKKGFLKRKAAYSRVFKKSPSRLLSLRKLKRKTKRLVKVLRQKILFSKRRAFALQKRYFSAQEDLGNRQPAAITAYAHPMKAYDLEQSSSKPSFSGYSAVLQPTSYVTNSFYKRSLLRRRVRAARVALRRIKLRATSPLVLPTLFEIGQKRPRYSKRAFWRRRKFERKALNRVFSKSHGSAAKSPLSLISKPGTAQARFSSLKNKQNREFFSNLPRFSPAYRLLFRRWHSRRSPDGTPIARVWPSYAETKRRARMNTLRFRQGLPPKKVQDLVFFELERELGSSSSLGYRRIRRTLQPKFNTNRWWRASALPSPVYHSAGVSFLKDSLPTPSQLAAHNNLASVQKTFSLLKSAKRTGLQRGANWKAYLPNVNLSENNGWRSLEGTLLQPANRGDFVVRWSKNRIGDIFADLERDTFSNVWARCEGLVGQSGARRLRKNFIENSSKWLSSRYYEKRIQNELLRSNTSGVAVRHANAAIFLNRAQLFKKFPNWWRDESLRRFRALEAALGLAELNSQPENNALPWKLMSLLKQQICGETSAYSSASMQTEKEVLKAVATYIPSSAKARLAKDYPLETESQLKLVDKSMSTPYQHWLRGIEGHMKKISMSRSSQDHADSRKSNITLLGTERARFPGIGRRKATYDSSVRAFYKKTLSARFRRTHGIRFRRLRPAMSMNFYTRLPSFESSTSDRRRARIVGSTTRVNYLNRQWRKLLRSRSALQPKAASTSYSSNRALSVDKRKTESASSKRRLASSPAERLFGDLYMEQKHGQLHNGALEATTEALLLSALAARTKNRQLQELSLHANRRLLPLEQVLPPWMASSKARKQRKARRGSKADYILPGAYERMNSSYWVTSGFSVSVPREIRQRDGSLTTTGEILTEPMRVSKVKVSERSWRLQRNKRKARRFRPFVRRYRGVAFRKPKKEVRNERYLYKSKRKFRNLRKSCKAVSRSSRILKKAAVCRLLKSYTVAATKFNYRLTRNVNNTARSVLTPIHFSRSTQEVVISEQEKTKQREGMAIRKQEHYRKTAQLADNFTTLFPQLISLLLARQSRKEVITSKAMRAAVHSAYWSIRYFLQTDRTGNLLAARDANHAQFNLLRNQLVRDSEDRYFDLNDLKAIRYRFQPHRLNYSRRLNRGAVDWLRMFFPRYHSLYLEDPEVYKNFFLSPIKTFRAHPSRKNPGEWQTNQVPGLMQNRFKRLTNPKDLQNSSRFESLLMTSRRSPVIVGHGATSRLKSVNFSGSLSPKGSFFNRQYSTSTFLKDTHTRELVLSRIATARRHTPSSKDAISDAFAVSKRYSLKARAYARGRSNYAIGRHETGAGSLDTRFSRAKSPRNRQFLQRVSRGGTVALTFKRKLIKEKLYKHLLSDSKSLEQSAYNRTTRAVRADTVTSSVAQTNNLPLLNFRASAARRRIPSFLSSRARVLRRSLIPFVEQRIFTKKNRAQSRAKKVWDSCVSSPGALKSYTETVSNPRSILDFRKAQHRSTHLLYSRSLSIPRKSVVMKRTVSSFLGSSGLPARLVRRILKARRSRATSWYQKKSLKVMIKKLQKNPDLAQLRVPKASVKLSLAKCRTSGVPLRYRFLNFLPRLKKTHNVHSYRLKNTFASQAKRIRYNRKFVFNFLSKQQLSSLENPEAVNRQELWDAISLRWMKKHRVLKNWLKDAKRGLKKHAWDFMPEPLFKGMRSRLRKLEWREHDGRFIRDGFRNAFRFFPVERRKATWLEKLMYRRALFSTIRGAYRRHQFPREQKRLKWLQQYRKAVFPSRRSGKYLKNRRWPKLRIYNQRLFRGLFSLRNKRTAQRHFQKLNRRKPVDSGFAKSLTGLGDRLDVNLVLLNIAPTIFWAKVLAAFGLFQVNNKVVKDPSFRFKKNDRIYWNWVLIERLRIYFKPVLQRYETEQQHTSAQFPKNFEYFPGIRTAIYRRLPVPGDFPKNSRISPFLFRMFREDSVSGK